MAHVHGHFFVPSFAPVTKLIPPLIWVWLELCATSLFSTKMKLWRIFCSNCESVNLCLRLAGQLRESGSDIRAIRKTNIKLIDNCKSMTQNALLLTFIVLKLVSRCAQLHNR